MGKRISLDLRERLVTAYDNGEGSQEELAVRFVVSQSMISNLLKRRDASGSLAPTKPPGRPPKIQQAEILATLVETSPDATLAELAEAFGQETGVSVSLMAVQRSLKRLGLTRKKKSLRSRSGSA